MAARAIIEAAPPSDITGSTSIAVSTAISIGGGAGLAGGMVMAAILGTHPTPPAPSGT